MLAVFSSIFVLDTKIIFVYNFVAFLTTDLIKRDLKLIRVDTKSRDIFEWDCYVRQRESTSAAWMSKIYATIKRFGEP